MLERYYRELLNFCARTVKNREAAKDVVQESYARVLAVQESGQPIAEPRALLHQTARRLMIDQHRRQAIREHEDIDGLGNDDTPASPRHLQPEAVYESGQHAQAILAAIEALPPRCREAFILNRFDGLSHQEVADRMGISKNMVAQHVIRGVLACKACEDRLNGVPSNPPPSRERKA
nr:sigma-70 family RNA polymerase sigma factor [uncultured Achromobacter sp.]